MLILKSASPRRKQIFENLGLEFQIAPSSINEDQNPSESPLEYLKRVTIAKLDNPINSDTNIYVSSDTIVVWKEKIFPKPETLERTIEYLEQLNGKTHEVLSGMGIFHEGKILFEYDKTEVQFKNWSKEEIQNYATKYKPFDKAGAYGIQDKEGPVESFTGSYMNVLGFPLRNFLRYKEIWEKYIVA